MHHKYLLEARVPRTQSLEPCAPTPTLEPLPDPNRKDLALGKTKLRNRKSGNKNRKRKNEHNPNRHDSGDEGERNWQLTNREVLMLQHRSRLQKPLLVFY